LQYLNIPFGGLRVCVCACPCFFTSPFSFRLVTTAFEIFEYAWEVHASMRLLISLMYAFWVLFRVTKTFLKIPPSSRAAPRLDSHGWHGIWEYMGRYLENFSPSMVWFNYSTLMEWQNIWKQNAVAPSKKRRLPHFAGP